MLFNSQLLWYSRFPRREDYEEAQVVQLDETYEEKLTRLLETIESSQINIKEVVDKDFLGLEEKIFRILDLKQVGANSNINSTTGLDPWTML